MAFVPGSAYSIFFAANAPNADTITVQQAVETLTAEYRDRLETISDTVQHAELQDIVGQHLSAAAAGTVTPEQALKDMQAECEQKIDLTK